MLFVEGKLTLTVKERLFLIFEGLEENYKAWMDLARSDWLAAIDAFVGELKKGKPTRSKLALLQQAEGIKSGDRQFFHAGAQDESDAAQFLISNTIMAGQGLKASPPASGAKAKKYPGGGLGGKAPQMPAPQPGLEEGY